MNKSLSVAAPVGVRVESLETRRLCSLAFQFDYRFDSSGFFASQSRRDVLAAAGKAVAGRLADTFDAIASSGGNSWSINLTTPSTGVATTINNPSVSANTVLVFVGARDLPGTTLAQGGPSGWGASGTTEWINKVRGRGEPGAVRTPRTDFAPKAGAITFDSLANFFFGTSVSGIGGSQTDFYSVAAHELGHVLGIGAGSETWPAYVSGGTFNGPKSKALYGKPVPLAADGAHLAQGLFSGGQEVAMDPSIKTGVRKFYTPLDFALLDDIGYDVTTPPATTGRITGNVFNDLDADAYKDGGEAGLAGWQVFLDKDKDGQYDTGETAVNTDAGGNYAFTVTPGSYRVAVTAKAGYRRTLPTTTAFYDATVTAGGTTASRNFGYTQKVLITGTVFRDADGDGVKDAGETGLGNWKVFLDKDNDGQPDPGEVYATTDAGGNWWFKTQPTGAFIVRVVQQPNYTLRSPSSKSYIFSLTSGQSRTALLFAEKPA